MRTPLALLLGAGAGVGAAIYLAARNELARRDPEPAADTPLTEPPATVDMPPSGASGPDGAVA